MKRDADAVSRAEIAHSSARQLPVRAALQRGKSGTAVFDVQRTGLTLQLIYSGILAL